MEFLIIRSASNAATAMDFLWCEFYSFILLPPPPSHAFSFVAVVHVRINEYDLLPGLTNLTRHEIFLIDEQLFLNRWSFILQTSLRPALQGDWQFYQETPIL
jgi:hypothetical protein